jgi:hypothetical protein
MQTPYDYGISMPYNTLELEREKIRASNRKSPKFEEKEDVFYYKCIYHKTIFCYDCVTNFGKREIEYSLAPKCDKHEVPQKDCIYMKIPLEDDKSVTCIWCNKKIK